ncbi:protease [Candidatus Pacearchaeota archaeon]|nr:protease [Candidatus Pacearchaeota archaeon]
MMKQKLELLAPISDFTMLHSAIEAGANAVYFGLKEFNMRKTGKNFTLKDLDKIEKICKPKKIKRYLTLNVIIYNNELKKVENIIKKVKGKINAIICWDLSVIQLCKKHKIPFHISTQASISNVEAAKFYKKLGAERIVLARELNLKQIKEIKKKAKIEVECFAHGAMCVSISGRCFTSQFQSNLSANRGQCSHPCRRAYEIKDLTDPKRKLRLENNRVMSAKDLCTLPFLEQMKKAGITSFKIEGRNRTAEYVSIVIKEYRKALDKKLSKTEIIQSMKNLKKAYNRGFSSGFYIKMPTSDDFSFTENGEQTEFKEYVGRIERYWPKAKAASLKMHAGKIKVGDEIYLISKDKAIKKLKVPSMEKHHKKIKQAKKGDEIGIKLPNCEKGTLVYKIVKRKI